MRTGKLFIVLLAGALSALPACKKDGGGEGPNGSVVYDGSSVAMEAPIFEGPIPSVERPGAGRWRPPGGEYEPYDTYAVGMSSHAATEDDLSKVTSFYFITTLPDKDFSFDVSTGSYSDCCASVYFFARGRLYRTHLLFSVPEARGGGTRGVKSIGINPATGREYEPGELPGTPDAGVFPFTEVITITGGSVGAKWSAESLRVEFELTFADGRSAKGHGEIPRSLMSSAAGRSDRR